MATRYVSSECGGCGCPLTVDLTADEVVCPTCGDRMAIADDRDCGGGPPQQTIDGHEAARAMSGVSIDPGSPLPLPSGRAWRTWIVRLDGTEIGRIMHTTDTDPGAWWVRNGGGDDDANGWNPRRTHRTRSAAVRWLLRQHEAARQAAGHGPVNAPADDASEPPY